MIRAHEASFIREAVVSMVVIVGLYGLAYAVQFPPLQIPGYLLIVGFGPFEGFVELIGIGYDVLFALYLLGLGLLGAVFVHALRTRTHAVPSWRLGVAGALTVVGVISLLFALTVSFQISYPTPILITGTTGLILLALAGWLVGLFARGATATSK